MLVKNVLKNIKKHPFRMLGIILMIIFAEILYVSLSYVIIDAKDSLSVYTKNEHQEDFSFDMNDELTSTEVNLVASHYAAPPSALYDLNATDKALIIHDRIASIESTYPVQIESRNYKQLSYHSDILNKDLTVRIFENNHNIDLTYVNTGRLPEKDNEVALTPTFLLSNHLLLGDSIDIGANTYIIVGTVFFVDYSYPQLSNDSLVFDSSKQALGVFTDSAFQSFAPSEVTYYVGTFLSNMTIDSLKSVYMTNITDTATNMRTGAIVAEIHSDQKFVGALSGVLVLLSVILIGMMVNKSIEREKMQIGVIKSLGYSSLSVLRAYMVYPLLTGILGTVFGYVLGVLAEGPLIQFFNAYYQMPIGAVGFDWTIFLETVIFPITALNLFSAGVIYLIVKKPPLQLIKLTDKVTINPFVRLINRLLKSFKFKTRFKYSTAFRSLGKLVITFAGIFAASIYLVFSLSGMNSFSSILDNSYANANYTYQVLLNTPETAAPVAPADTFMLMPSKTVINNKDVDVTLMGIDRNLTFYKLSDQNGKDLSLDLYENTDNAVISSMLATMYNLKTGSVIQLKMNNVSGQADVHSLTVVGIVENYTAPYVFMQKTAVNGLYGLPAESYNGLWTNTKMTDNVASIYSKTDMIKATESLIGTGAAFLYTMIAVSVILAVMVLLIIAGYTIEDNHKTISYLKVMGYDEKMISGMVINIYLPVVILAYLLAVPSTLYSLQTLMNSISKQLNFTIPFTLSYLQVIIGFAVVLLTYYGSLYLSKRRLNKVPLQEALKVNE